MPWRKVDRVSDRFGDLLFAALRAQRRIAERNLEIAFGDEMPVGQRRRIARGAFRNLARSAIEFAKLPTMPDAELRALAPFEGFEHIERALELGKGVIYYTAHFGNWELMGARMAQAGRPLTAIVRDLHNPYVNDLVNETRRKIGLRVLVHGNAILSGMRTLRANGLLAVLADQDAGPDSLFVPFFGTLAASVAGPAVIARKTGAPVIPAFDVRQPDGSHTIHILPALDLQHTDDADADAWENTRRMLACVETMIRRHPDQWLWQHKRWRTRPPGDTTEFYDLGRNGRSLDGAGRTE
jgi:KDO2-lipid IV(A) lauroyltransferase